MNGLVGTGKLVRFALRRDRIMLPVWLVVLTVTAVSTASAFAKLYPTPLQRLAYGEGINANPTLRAIYGQVYAPSTVGGLTVSRISTLAVILTALLTAFTVVRHTRAEEEAGRLELLGATVVGRLAPLTAALIFTGLSSVVLAGAIGVGLLGQHLPAAGSFAFGLSLGALGIVFAGIAAVAAQLTESARGARGYAGAAVGLAFVLRAVGDASGPGGHWVAWLSPFGWVGLIRSFAGERWWLLALPVALAALLVSCAYALVSRRDLGAGLLPTRPGPAKAPRDLRNAFGLAWRQQRGALLGWAVGMTIGGAAMGGIADAVGSLVNSSPQVEQAVARMGGQAGLVNAFLAAIMGFFALLASAYAVQATLRLRAEETAQRAEPLLATRVSRLGFTLSHLVVAVLGAALLLALAGLAEGLTHGARAGDVGTQVLRLLGAGLAQLPAVLVLAGLATALFGLAPRLTQLSWAVLVGFVLLGQFGPVFRLNQAVMDISPFTHIPKLPGTAFTAVPLAWLALIAAALIAAGLFGIRRRDIG